MSFKSVQTHIEKEGYGKRAAGAILAKSTRDASAAAKKANPALKKVKGAPDPKPRRMTIEPADNGGFISRTEHETNRKPGDPWQEPKETKNVHGSVNALAQHVKNTFPPKAKKTGSQPKAAWKGVADKMLGSNC